MNIIEEYIERKNLKHIPSAHHCMDGLVLVRQKKQPKIFDTTFSSQESETLSSYLSLYYYVYMIIRWNEKPKGPGSYNIQFVSPIKLGENFRACIRHSCSVDRSVVFKNIVSKTIEYDDYETTMLGWIDSFVNDGNWILASDKNDAYFMLWESFVYMFDRYFADLSSQIKSFLWESMKNTNDCFSRRAAIATVLGYIEKDCKSVADLWSRDFMIMSYNFCDWSSSFSKRYLDITFRDIS